MDPTFGARLRSHREQQQISLTIISEQTKIKLSLLEALERDDISHWPLGLFGRSYIRSYALAVGLDPEATVREFMEQHPDARQAAPPPLDELKQAAPVKPSRRPPTRLQFLIDSAIDAFHSKRAEFVGAPERPATRVQPAPPETTAPMPEPPVDYRPVDYGPSDHRPSAIAFSIDFSRVAHLCTRLACAQEAQDVTAALEDAAIILDAVGLTLWVPEAMGTSLMPAFAHGYSQEMVSQLPPVYANANNAVAEAFRTRSTCAVNGGDGGTGALVIALLTPNGCSGVLAVELRNGAERREEVRAAVTILAAQLSTVMGVSVLAQTMSA
jgi:Helix-turn-helix domain